MNIEREVEVVILPKAQSFDLPDMPLHIYRTVTHIFLSLPFSFLRCMRIDRLQYAHSCIRVYHNNVFIAIIITAIFR